MKRKPTGFHTEGQGIDRKVIPHFAPSGQTSLSRFIHPSREQMHRIRTSNIAATSVLDKRSLQKLFGVSVSSRGTDGPKYHRANYHFDKGDKKFTVQKYTYHYDNSVNYDLVVEQTANVKEDSPEYKKLLSQYGTLSVYPDGRITKPVMVKTNMSESEMKALLSKLAGTSSEKYIKIKHDDPRYRNAKLTSAEIAMLSPATRKDYFSWAYSIRRHSDSENWLPPLDPDDPFLTWNPPYLVHRVPKTEHVHKLLETKTVAASGGDACFSETVTAHVPYFGAMFEFDKQKMIDRGVKPLWYSRSDDVPMTVNAFYGGQSYMYHGGLINRKEYEWNHPRPMKIELSDIKAIWVPMYHQKELHAIREDVKRHGLRIPVGTVSSRPYYRRYNEDFDIHTVEGALTETQWEQRNLSRFVNLGILPKSVLNMEAVQ